MIVVFALILCASMAFAATRGLRPAVLRLATMLLQRAAARRLAPRALQLPASGSNAASVARAIRPNELPRPAVVERQRELPMLRRRSRRERHLRLERRPVRVRPGAQRRRAMGLQQRRLRSPVRPGGRRCLQHGRGDRNRHGPVASRPPSATAAPPDRHLGGGKGPRAGHVPVPLDLVVIVDRTSSMSSADLTNAKGRRELRSLTFLFHPAISACRPWPARSEHTTNWLTAPSSPAKERFAV